VAITQTMCTSFKKALLDGEMDFSSNTSQTFKIALFTSAATLNADTTAYTSSNEVVGAGYTAGGNTLTVIAPATSGTTAFLDFSDTTWSTATITARGALIYQSGGSNPAVAVLDFGSDKSTVADSFTVQFPTADASTAIVRIA
jgi:VCBS repeat-containing protein